MSTKRTMTLNLTAQEMAVLEQLAEKKDLSKTAVMKLALRLLQTIDVRVEPGKKLLVEDEATNEKSELVIL
ncbi:transcriptional regulator [Roseibacillus persicicus]